MSDGSADNFEADGLDQWSNTIGDDEELIALWAALLAATQEAGPKELDASLAQHFATLGARSRRTTEGLILAVIAATAAEGPAWEDWRVVLHRHFARDERMDLAVAAAILLEWRKEETTPDWRSLAERVTERVFRSYIQDMRSLLDLLDKPDEAAAAAAGLVMLASELFDVAIAMEVDGIEELQHSVESAELIQSVQQRLSEKAEDQSAPVAQNLAKAQALIEVTLRQLEIGPSVVH
ncbi:hypothetical protein ACELLULO517_07130 [Acidisoma cellulosilytica]|uniref:Uncharacterized protein n=1 Tax=Acidisoma cellulosilyticum TaxID=2802395 RepID=A0A963YZX5_9PROT|nr:hypothetical protein [Acidisoma cellulosilyticum]MCB8880001.1 hypothetical protein [Acidisoma cellulosilyticum]